MIYNNNLTIIGVVQMNNNIHNNSNNLMSSNIDMTMIIICYHYYFKDTISVKSLQSLFSLSFLVELNLNLPLL